jgi:hypothetical protein
MLASAKSILANPAVGLLVVVPLLALLVGLQVLQAVPSDNRAHPVVRRWLVVAIVVLLVVFAAAVLGRFHFLD